MSRKINRKSCQIFSGFLRAKVLKNKTRTTNPKEFFDKSEKRKIREANTKLAVKLAMAPAG
jgi:hypothetical protein